MTCGASQEGRGRVIQSTARIRTAQRSHHPIHACRGASESSKACIRLMSEDSIGACIHVWPVPSPRIFAVAIPHNHSCPLVPAAHANQQPRLRSHETLTKAPFDPNPPLAPSSPSTSLNPSSSLRPHPSSTRLAFSSFSSAASIRLLTDRKSTRLNSSHSGESRMPSSA